MANFYCDVSAIGNEYQAYADIPTWGALTTDKPLPQDGNGKAGPGHTAAVSVGTIDCTLASCSGAGGLVLFGATVSTTLTGSGSTLASNIVTAINGSSAATTVTYCALLLPIRYFVYARVDPANANIVQIAHRIAGAYWNGMVAATSLTWGALPTMGAFAGGANGPFGYCAPVNVTCFGKAGGTYGVMMHKSPGADEPTSNDYMLVRTSRNGTNLSETFSSTGTSHTLLATAVVRHIIFDNGATWAGENGVFTWNVVANSNMTYEIYITFGISSFYSKTQFNFVLNVFNLSSASSHYIGIGTRQYDGCASFIGSKISEDATGSTAKGIRLGNVSSSSPQLSFTDCWLVFNAPRPLFYGFSNITFMHYINCKFSARSMSGLWQVMNFTGVAQGFNSFQLSIIGGEFDSANTYQAIVSSGLPVTGYTSFSLVLDRVKNLLYSSAGIPASQFNISDFSYTGFLDEYGFRYENNQVVLDYEPATNPPYLLSTLPNGSTWSQRLMLKGGAFFNHHKRQVYRATTKYRGASSASSASIKFITDSSNSFTNNNLSLMVTYQSTDNNFYTDIPHTHSSTSSVIPVASDVWSNQGLLSAYAVATTTSHPIKADSVVHVALFFEGVLALTKTIYLEPEVVFA